MTNQLIKQNSNKKHNVYIASPFFNDIDNERLDIIESMLDKEGLTYFSPRHQSAIGPISEPEVRQKAFQMNVDNIKDADFVIAETSRKDLGTLFEAGLAYEAGIPIIYATFVLGEDGGAVNLMLSESAFATVTTPEQLKKAIKGEGNYHEGEII